MRDARTSTGIDETDEQPSDGPLAPPFATKIAVLVRDDLLSWQRLNVTAFLAGGIAGAHPHLVGRPYRDADGQEYLPLIGMPILVFEGPGPLLAQARSRALARDLRPALYTRGMFDTGHDRANRAVVAAVAGEYLDLVGIAVHGPKGAVDKIVKGASLHP
jgi:hypothetical protein